PHCHRYTFDMSHAVRPAAALWDLSLRPAPATTAIYTLSLHDALPIYNLSPVLRMGAPEAVQPLERGIPDPEVLLFQEILKTRDGDRKSTRLNSSHLVISYAVFCLKKKKAAAWRPCRDERGEERELQEG